MIKITPAIIVEGRYDKNKIKQIFDTIVIDTSGFGIFNNDEQAALIRRLACERGVVVLTDSDQAGFMIRNYIKNIAHGGKIYNAYTPDIMGKERRKTKPSAEGKLGVEGISDDIIIEAVRKSGVMMEETCAKCASEITKADFFELGLTGGAQSKEKRAKLLKSLDLPENMTANALLEMVNILCTREELERAICD